MIIFLRDDMMADSDLEDKYSKYNFDDDEEENLILMRKRRLLKNPNQKLIKDRLQKNWKLLEIELLKEPVLI